MRSAIAVSALVGLAVSASAAPQQPFKFPLPNGFPNPSPAALAAIEKQAHGTLPNITLPKSVSNTTAATLGLIAFNEIFEVAYFTSLLNNITSCEKGYEIPAGAARDIVVNAITAVQAQEELHATGANAILQSAGRKTIAPCEYKFPATDLDTAVALASTFTDVVVGTLQDALNNFGTTGDTELLALVGSIIGQEGEQNGFYRALGNKIPSALPFLTRSTGPFAFSALNQMFVVPGSCPFPLTDIPLPVFAPLTVATSDIKLEDQTLSFSFEQPATPVDPSTLSVVYVNQQNVPVVTKLENIKTSGSSVTFDAKFPAKSQEFNGLTIAALTKSAGPFMSVPAVANVTMFGPGLIEIN